MSTDKCPAKMLIEARLADGTVVPFGEPRPRGRPKGSKNKRTKAVEDAMRPLEPRAKRCLKELLDSDDEAIRLKAAELVYAYRYGKPKHRSELSGVDGAPIRQETQIIEASKRVAQVMAGAANKNEPKEALGDEGLRAAQALNYLHARMESAESPKPLLAPTTPTQNAKVTQRPSVDSVDPICDLTPPEPPSVGSTLRFQNSDWHILGRPPQRPGLPNRYELRCATGLVCGGTFDHCLTKLRQRMGEDLGDWSIQEPTPEPDLSRPDQHAAKRAVRPAVHRRR